jgi:hypothetical protein
MTRRLAAALALSTLLGACGDGGTGPRVPTSLQLSHGDLTLDHGESVTLAATLLDQHGSPFTTPPAGHGITWSSSAPHVAEVGAGVVETRGLGRATLTARAGSVPPASVQVSVTALMRLSFQYAGSHTGTFTLDRTAGDDAFGDGEWAMSTYDSEARSQILAAYRVRPDGRLDLFAILVDGRITSPRTQTLHFGEAVLMLGVETTGAEPRMEGQFLATAGSVTFSQATLSRLKGTFSIAMVGSEPGSTLTLSSGVLDVPVFDESAMGAPSAVAAAGMNAAREALRLQGTLR